MSLAFIHLPVTTLLIWILAVNKYTICGPSHKWIIYLYSGIVSLLHFCGSDCSSPSLFFRFTALTSGGVSVNVPVAGSHQSRWMRGPSMSQRSGDCVGIANPSSHL
jgi:hypothetical protein